MTRPMRCCHCGRRLARAAGMTDRGPVGLVCALKLGLPQQIKPAGRVRVRFFERPIHRADPHTLDWIREAQEGRKSVDGDVFGVGVVHG